MKRILCIASLLIIILSTTVCAFESDYTYDDLGTLRELIAEKNSDMDAAHQMAESARRFGEPEDSEIIKFATEKYRIAEIQRRPYQTAYDYLMSRWHQKEEEYPTATYIWSYLKDLGYSNQVCAGILGNIMAEVGGQTLDIQWDLDTYGFYGMCMWSKQFCPMRKGDITLEDQCNYLRDDIEYQFDVFGFLSGYTYEQFLEIEDCKKVAVAFAKSYERCGSGSYWARQTNSQVALEYFTA